MTSSTTPAPQVPGVITSWPEVITALIKRHDLSTDQAAWAMNEILGGEASVAQIAGFAVALRAKGESIAEVEGLVEAMYAHATPLPVQGRVLDVVGTGGDRSFSVNISTMAAIVAAGAGAVVVKHGNRSASSQAGTADVLEVLGVRLDVPPQSVADLARTVGITFCFAPAFHPALRHAAAARRELGVGTTFNILGPLANPARPAASMIGCADRTIAPVMAGVFARRGQDAWVVNGDDGLDELTTTTTSTVWAVSHGSVTQHVLDPVALGVPKAEPADLRGGDAFHNAGVVTDLLAGKTGPVRDAVVLNAGAALAVYADESGSLEDRLVAGMARAAAAIDSGAARAKLADWVAATAN